MRTIIPLSLTHIKNTDNLSMKFSIGIPAYKAKFLHECIKSILSQTYRDFELIIVNDASPENLDEIVNDFTDNRIQYYKNEKNFGAVNVVDNWNKCLSYARGDYFVLMGDDDKMCPDYLEEFDHLIKKYPELGVYHCRTKIINENSDFITLTEARPEKESTYESIWHRITAKRTQFISDFVYHTKALKKNKGFYKIPLAWASDDISAYIAAYPKGIAHTNKPVFMYRKNTLTITSTGNEEIKMEAMQQEKEWIQQFLQNQNPKTKTDVYLNQMISNQLNKYITKRKLNAIATNLTKAPIPNFAKWLRSRKKFEITFPVLIYAVILSVKVKKKRSLYNRQLLKV